MSPHRQRRNTLSHAARKSAHYRIKVLVMHPFLGYEYIKHLREDCEGHAEQARLAACSTFTKPTLGREKFVDVHSFTARASLSAVTMPAYPSAANHRQVIGPATAPMRCRGLRPLIRLPWLSMVEDVRDSTEQPHRQVAVQQGYPLTERCQLDRCHVLR